MREEKRPDGSILKGSSCADAEKAGSNGEFHTLWRCFFWQQAR